MTMSMYKKNDCVLIPNGKGWPDNNSRPGRDEAEDLPGNSIGYLVARGARGRSRIFVVGLRRIYWIDDDLFEKFDPTTTGVRTELKICLSCHRLKVLGEFPNNQSNRAGQRTTRPRCSECYQKESGPNLTKRVRESFMERVGAPQQGDLWECPVCHKISIADVTAKVVVDHDQEKHQPRGIICDSCNTGLGRFKNGEDHLRDALEYLRRYQERVADGK